MKMKPLGEFLIVHDCSVSGKTKKSIEEIQQECLRLSPSSKIPELWQNTILSPPFTAVIDRMKFFTKGLRIAKDAYENENQRNSGRVAETSNIYDVDYINDDEKINYLILKLSLPFRDRKIIESYRRELSRFVRWPTDFKRNSSFDPHICILKGKKLNQETSLYLWGKKNNEFHASQTPVSLSVSFPQIMINVNDGTKMNWEPFIPSRY